MFKSDPNLRLQLMTLRTAAAAAAAVYFLTLDRVAVQMKKLFLLCFVMCSIEFERAFFQDS